MKIMGKVIAVLVCLLIVVMDATAGILGIKAQAAQDDVKHLKLWIFECKKTSNEAFVLGELAAIVLTVSHFLANLIGCIGCFKRNSNKSGAPTQCCSKAFFIFLWIVAAGGLGLLVFGTLSNKESGSSCGLADRRYLSNGGFACFAHAVFAVAYIATTNAAA